MSLIIWSDSGIQSIRFTYRLAKWIMVSGVENLVWYV